MDEMDRRTLLKTAAGGATLLAGGGAAGFVWLNRKFNPKTPLDYEFPNIARAANSELLATPSCDEPVAATIRRPEGPFYKPRTPERSELREDGISGTPLVVEGLVMDTRCRPVADAVIDIWSCDGEGIYDNNEFRLRGHQFTDANGMYRFSTVRPTAYKAGFRWRTPHIHVKVQGADTSLLTTQLYFPDEALNGKDSMFDEGLLMQMKPDNHDRDSLVARYDFVLV